MREFYGASKMLTREDGEVHQRLRGVMRDGFSREAVRGRYHELAATIDDSISSKWKTGSEAPVVEAFQYMIVQELGEILTGSAPLDMSAIFGLIFFISLMCWLHRSDLNSS